MIRTAAAALIVALLNPGAGWADSVPSCPLSPDASGSSTGGCGASVSTNPVEVLHAASHVNRVYFAAMNVGSSASGDPVAWCSLYGAPGAHAPGSFPLAPPGNAFGEPSIREFNSTDGQIVPQQALLCVSENGTAKLTIESRP